MYTSSLESRLVLGLFVACGCASNARADVTFLDTEFDLGNYTIQQNFGSGQTASFSQSLTEGNPGAALVGTSTIPATGFENAYGREYFLNKNFVYDPSVGSIDHIDWSIDKFVQVLQPSNFGIVNGANIILLQGGELYTNGVAISAVQGSFEKGQNSDLHATDFNLITNLAQGATDSTKHPSFSSGLIEFGTSVGWGIPAGISQAVIDYKLDNLKIVVAVPEPSTYAMILTGLAIVGAARLRKSKAPDNRLPVSS